MYMLKSTAAVALFAAYAAAQTALGFTSAPSSVQAGQTYNLTWSGGDSTQPVTILLREGDPNNLNTISTITSSATGGSYEWAVPSTIADASDYAFEIVQGTANNYYGPFAVSGGTGTLSASSATASATGSSSASASASSASASASSASASASASASSSSTSSSSASKTSSTAASTSAPSSGANGLQSPIALILGAVAAMFYLA